ncbi:hypothetical protein BC827DRAFT_1156055 [Russula dissimulans]|nr:hypothetical protein BC827DRAFT_1156055 [Russula dissimulans]
MKFFLLTVARGHGSLFSDTRTRIVTPPSHRLVVPLLVRECRLSASLLSTSGCGAPPSKPEAKQKDNATKERCRWKRIGDDDDKESEIRGDKRLIMGADDKGANYRTR